MLSCVDLCHVSRAWLCPGSQLFLSMSNLSVSLEPSWTNETQSLVFANRCGCGCQGKCLSSSRTCNEGNSCGSKRANGNGLHHRWPIRKESRKNVLPMIFPHSSRSPSTREGYGIWTDVQLRAAARVIANLLQFDWEWTACFVAPVSLRSRQLGKESGETTVDESWWWIRTRDLQITRRLS